MPTRTSKPRQTASGGSWLRLLPESARVSVIYSMVAAGCDGDVEAVRVNTAFPHRGAVCFTRSIDGVRFEIRQRGAHMECRPAIGEKNL